MLTTPLDNLSNKPKTSLGLIKLFLFLLPIIALVRRAKLIYRFGAIKSQP